jgi:hypothetical protein
VNKNAERLMVALKKFPNPMSLSVARAKMNKKLK